MKTKLEDLKRYDFTSECKTCKYSRDLGLLEYCCGFVIDEIRRQKFEDMKKTVYEYMDFDDDLSLINPHNILFTEEDDWKVTLNFKTNLKHDRETIINELVKCLNNNLFFTNVKAESLEYQPISSIVSQTRIDSYI